VVQALIPTISTFIIILKLTIKPFLNVYRVMSLYRIGNLSTTPQKFTDFPRVGFAVKRFRRTLQVFIGIWSLTEMLLHRKSVCVATNASQSGNCWSTQLECIITQPVKFATKPSQATIPIL
jgi:hypothetical protein